MLKSENSHTFISQHNRFFFHRNFERNLIWNVAVLVFSLSITVMDRLHLISADVRTWCILRGYNGCNKVEIITKTNRPSYFVSFCAQNDRKQSELSFQFEKTRPTKNRASARVILLIFVSEWNSTNIFVIPNNKMHFFSFEKSFQTSIRISADTLVTQWIALVIFYRLQFTHAKFNQAPLIGSSYVRMGIIRWRFFRNVTSSWTFSKHMPRAHRTFRIFSYGMSILF